jgi:hypothetical protein
MKLKSIRLLKILGLISMLLPTLPYDGIHHPDMHMRVIDEETIVFDNTRKE